MNGIIIDAGLSIASCKYIPTNTPVNDSDVMSIVGTSLNPFFIILFFTNVNSCLLL